MTNEEIEKYHFKYYSLDLPLMKAISLLKALLRDLDDQLGSYSANYEMRSEAEAELKGVTRWCNYNPQFDCKKPKHYSRSVLIKTSLGWMHHCCSLELGIARLPDTYIEPTKDEIKATHEDRRIELDLIIKYKKTLATQKGIATKKAQAEKLDQEREFKKTARALERASRTPQEIAERKVARAQRKAEKALKLTLSVIAQN